MRVPENPQKILLVKPHPRLATVLGLQRFMLLEPLEFGYLAAAVPGHAVRVLDLRLYRNPLRVFDKTLVAFKPDIVGLTAYSHEASALKSLALRARQQLPNAIIVAGGHHATSVPTDLNIPQLDAIVRGDGCNPFRTLSKRYRRVKRLEGSRMP